jgi:hypothetical protein
MKIGILSYHSACNYGANLQVLSTVGYLRRKGHNPIVINYETDEFLHFYKCITPSKIYDAFYAFRHDYMPLSKHCHTLDTLAKVIEDSQLDAVIIGSDAVAQHLPLLSRINFPTRTFLSITRMTSDRYFPNPFWGIFRDVLSRPIPMALLSASSQDSNYKLFSPSLKKQMWERLQKFSYISARDEWTKEMYSAISHSKLKVEVTPDPVFAFNINADGLIPNRAEILTKFNLPEKYFVISFLTKPAVSQEWLSKFEKLAKEKGIVCVMLPFSYKKSLGKTEYVIDLPLSPIEWYALIKYSSGYIGHNMHPIVVSLTNDVPFFSFDNWGTKGLWKFDETSSKIYHILSEADLLENRIRATTSNVKVLPKSIVDRIISFDVEKSNKIATRKYNEYEEMMKSIISLFNVK